MDIEDFVIERRRADPDIVDALFSSFLRAAAEVGAVRADVLAALAQLATRAVRYRQDFPKAKQNQRGKLNRHKYLRLQHRSREALGNF